ncbi:hypothetical protein [Cupriavidus basilensis]|uniref:hypothetical protein n=1 Tax=Cupriavidus basilensis TaxID=68895 RepID=UPI0039F72AE3
MEATKEQGDAAKKNAMRAEMLRAQARRFMKFVGECLAQEGFMARAAVEGPALPGDERESFELNTSFGRVYAQFGFAKWDGHLVGRYQFSRFILGADEMMRLVPFHVILIEDQGNATFAEDGFFEWKIPDSPDSNYGPALVGCLLHGFQESLPQLKRPR